MIKFNVKPVIDGNKLNSLRMLSERIKNIPGSLAEVGVFQGGSLIFLCEVNKGRKAFGFDTFEGLPEPKLGAGELHTKGSFANTNFEQLREYLEGIAILIKGLFPDSAASVSEERFALVHLDMDYGDGTKKALEWFWPRMQKGGIIVLDDYDWRDCPNIKPVVDAFAAEHGIQVQAGAACQAFLVVE